MTERLGQGRQDNSTISEDPRLFSEAQRWRTKRHGGVDNYGMPTGMSQEQNELVAFGAVVAAALRDPVNPISPRKLLAMARTEGLDPLGLASIHKEIAEFRAERQPYAHRGK